VSSPYPSLGERGLCLLLLSERAIRLLLLGMALLEGCKTTTLKRCYKAAPSLTGSKFAKEFPTGDILMLKLTNIFDESVCRNYCKNLFNLL
jgi:hypothetical protein